MAAGLAEPRCASERGLAMGGERPAERRFKVGGSSKSVARCHRSVLAYWKFESISLQQRVHELSVPERDIGLERRRPIARDLSHSASVTTRETGAFPRPSKAVLDCVRNGTVWR
jgi:hypothetical protein